MAFSYRGSSALLSEIVSLLPFFIYSTVKGDSNYFNLLCMRCKYTNDE